MPDDETTFIPRVLGVHLGINFFDESQDPVIIFNAMLPADMDGELAHATESPDVVVLPLAFTPGDLQALIPQIVESVIRSRTIMEMLTTWPEHREEILQNLVFRWTGQLEKEDGNGDEP